MSASATPIRRTTRAALLPALLVVYLFTLIGLDVLSMRTGRSGGQLINGDAKGYYTWLRSVALDHDIDFRNDYALIYPPEPLPDDEVVTSRGLVSDKYPVGLGVVEVPGFLVGHLAARTFGYPADGVSAPYQLAIVVWLQLLCIASFAALWVALVRLGAQRDIATVLIASALLATNLLQYLARPALAHGPGVAMMNLAFLLMVTARGARDENRRILGVGVLLGLALIIRPSNLAMAPFFALFLVGSFARWKSHIGRLLLGAAPMVALHLASLWALWGSVRATGYGNEGFTAGWAGIVGTLFSSRHGLFIYHPWYLIMLGISVLALRNSSTRRMAAAALLSFTGLACINGLWWCWWFGGSFGNRAFIELIPALIVPAALWLSGLPAVRQRFSFRTFAATAMVLTAANLLLWTGYVLKRFPADGLHSVADAYLWPAKHATSNSTSSRPKD